MRLATLRNNVSSTPVIVRFLLPRAVSLTARVLSFALSVVLA